MAALFDSMDKLTTMPTIGRARNDLPDGYKMYSVGKHIIVYHVRHNQLIVMRVLHQKMDILRHLTCSLIPPKPPPPACPRDDGDTGRKGRFCTGPFGPAPCGGCRF